MIHLAISDACSLKAAKKKIWFLTRRLMVLQRKSHSCFPTTSIFLFFFVLKKSKIWHMCHSLHSWSKKECYCCVYAYYFGQHEVAKKGKEVGHVVLKTSGFNCMHIRTIRKLSTPCVVSLSLHNLTKFYMYFFGCNLKRFEEVQW